ncbi:MAG: 50S ribosomal protein L3 [Nanoarchaeota archaeon]
MPTVRNPRKGSMQFWHRARAKRAYARVRSYIFAHPDPKPLGFAGYKAGMGHAMVTDNRPNSPTNKQKIAIPFTILECPPLRVASIILYYSTPYGLTKIGQINAEKMDKDLGRTIILPKKTQTKTMPTDISEIRLLVHTQPKLAQLKKKPEIFELAIGGKTIQDKLSAAQQLLGKEISVRDIFTEGNQVDIHAITRGHGIQGPVKRFGIGLRSHKSEKTKRGPGNVGPWAGNRSWTVSHAGQDGYHQRFQHNSLIIQIGDKGSDVTRPGGIPHYGIIKNQYMLVKGSVGGSTKRLIRLTPAIRPHKILPKDAPKIDELVL